MIKKISVVVLVLALLGGVFAYMQFNKEHRDINAEEATEKVTAIDLFQSYVDDEAGANAKFLDKVVEISGVIVEISAEAGSEFVVLQSNDDFFGVNVYFDDVAQLNGLEVGANVKVKGHCTGGDSMGVVIAHCSVIK
jgi:hypothetical protein